MHEGSTSSANGRVGVLLPGSFRRPSVRRPSLRRPSVLLAQFAEFARRGSFSTAVSGEDRVAAVVACVIRIQRAFRLRETLFRHFGAEMFVDSAGNKSAHGKLLFEGAASVPRPFIIVSDTSSPSMIAQFISKFWNLPQPEVLITITGGAQDFSLSTQQVIEPLACAPIIE